MIKIYDKSKCSGCSACSASCPQKCIKMVQDEEGFFYPSVNTSKCVSCGICNKTCPIANNVTTKDNAIQLGYAAYNLNQNIRTSSSSGGLFSLLAENIIDKGGIVFGAAMSDNYKQVRHIMVDKTEDLYKLRGSKYVQSNIENVYSLAKKYLENGRKVLFTGTPCEIGGLYSFLNKEYDNLFTQDLICHGSSSPLIWEHYIDSLERKYEAKVTNANFRSKAFGWRKFSMSLVFSNNRCYTKKHNKDYFLKGFLNNLYLRPSCYDCSFKTMHRQSDITLADFWGIENVMPEIDDNNGLSFAWIHSQKGMDLFYDISEKMKYTEVNIDEAIKYNYAAIKSCNMNTDRERFYKDFKTVKIDLLLKKYTHKSIIYKLIKVSSNIFR